MPPFVRFNSWSRVCSLYHERTGAFDGFGLSFGTQHALRAREVRLIELEMCVSTRSAVSHGLSPLDLESLCTLNAEGALPPRAGDLWSCWNEMAGVRCQFQFSAEHA
jgi:hypothetical protein